MSSPTDLRGSSQRNYSKGGMTPGYEFADDDSHSKYMSDHSRNKNAYDRDTQDSEVGHQSRIYVTELLNDYTKIQLALHY